MTRKAIQKPKPNPNFTELSDGFFDLVTPIGVDEAGRGSLAGPVVAAAVILPRGVVIDGVRDSKVLSPKRREVLAAVIREKAVAFSFGYSDSLEIDKINILQATMKAMAQAVEGVSHAGTDLFALIDGNRAPELRIPSECIVDGDSVCYLIAAASILAKVERDALMVRLAEEYPEYGFASHKGYGTVAHRAALKEYGPCAIHRMSFKLG